MMTIFTRLLGRRSKHSQSLGFVEAQRMVLDYARFLDHSPPMPGRVKDASSLPHNKAELKAALLLCIGHTGDGRLEEHLKSGYLMLSAFQEGVGEDLGTDFACLDLEQDPLEVAALLEQDAESAHPWQACVREELHSLQQDLYALELQLAEPVKLFA